MKFWCLMLAMACALAGCGAAGDPAEVPAEDPAEVRAVETDPPSLEADEEPVVMTCRIVDGAADGDLLLAELEGPYGGKGVFRLSAEGLAVTLDGEAADASALEDGMPVDVFFNGMVMETFPARLGEAYSIAAWSIGQEKNGGGSCYDLCGLYLQVLDDLWQKDPALNEDIAIAGLDLSEAPGDLTESEKAALAWRFGEMHGVEVVTGTFQELEEQGYFTASAISTPPPDSAANYSHMWNQWEDGCFFSIRPNSGHEGEVYSLPVIFFDAEKWRSPLAAYCFYDCSAGWPQCGTWSGYQVGGEMIS